MDAPDEVPRMPEYTVAVEFRTPRKLTRAEEKEVKRLASELVANLDKWNMNVTTKLHRTTIVPWNDKN